MGDPATTTKATEADTPQAWPERPPMRQQGTERLRCIALDREGWRVRTYDIPPNVLRKFIVHERPPLMLGTALASIAGDLDRETQGVG